MIPVEPDPNAPPPGMLHTPGGTCKQIGRWLRHHGIRLRWELAPFYGALPFSGLMNAQAATDPGWGTPATYGGLGATLGVITLPLVDRYPTAAYGTAVGSGAAFYATYQNAVGPNLTGPICLTLATFAGSFLYWKHIKDRRDQRYAQLHELRVERVKSERRPIPAQGSVPELPVAPDPGAEEDDELASVTWPGTRPGLSINDPIQLSPYTSIVLPGGHVLIGGATNGGKSGIVHVICSNVITRRDARLLGADLKPGTLELGMYRKAGAWIAKGPAEARRMLEYVLEEGRRRGELMGASFETTGKIVRKWVATEQDPHLVVVIDELAELIDEDAKLAERLRSISRLLRAMGITLVCCTQSPSKGVWGGNTDSKGQFDLRICLRTIGAKQTNIILGDGSHGEGWHAHKLRGEGEFLIQSVRHTIPEPDRAYWLNDDVLAEHIQQWAQDPGLWQREAEPDPFAASPASAEGQQRARIIAYVKAFGPATPAKIAEAVGGRGSGVRSQLSKLAKAGVLEHDRDTSTYSYPTGASGGESGDVGRAARLHVVRGGRAGQS